MQINHIVPRLRSRAFDQARSHMGPAHFAALKLNIKPKTAILGYFERIKYSSRALRTLMNVGTLWQD